MDAISFLREDHVKVLRMLDELAAGPPERRTADEMEARKKQVTELIVAESQHEAVEEQYFWPAVREAVPGGGRLADTAVSQEEDAKHLLDRLDHAEPDDPGYETLLGDFIKDGREHIEYEETQVWPKLSAALDAERLEELGTKMERAKKAAPTRPHPRTPSSPAAQKTAGPGAAMMDKVRDAVSGRRQDT